MALTTPDVIGLLALSILTVGFGLYVRHVDRILRDPDHPRHEDVKEAVQAGFEEARERELRDPFR